MSCDTKEDGQSHGYELRIKKLRDFSFFTAKTKHDDHPAR